MKKRLLLIIAILMFALLFAACGRTNETDSGKKTEGETLSATALYAEVIDVVSNQLSLKVLNGGFDADQMAQRMAEMQNRIASMRESGELPEDGMFSRRAVTGRDGELVTNVFRGERPTDADGEPITMQPGQPITGPNGEPITNAEGEPMTVPAMRERYTGEEKDVIIPVGTPIKSYSITMPDAQLKIKDADLADIKNGATVNIVYNDDGESIKEVQIVEMGRMGGGGPMMFGGPGGMPGELPPNAEVFDMGDGRVLFRAQAPE